MNPSGRTDIQLAQLSAEGDTRTAMMTLMLALAGAWPWQEMRYTTGRRTTLWPDLRLLWISII